jgi:hypothetical protein
VVRPQDRDLMRGSYDGPAIASLVLGIIAIVPLAIGFAIAGLRNTRDGRRRGRWMAVTSLVLTAAWIAVFALAVVTARGDQAHRTADGSVSRAGGIPWYSVRLGDCIQLPVGIEALQDVTVVPCGQPHNAQAFDTLQLTGSTYPGDDAVRTRSLNGCDDLVPAFLGQSQTPLHVVALFPSDLRWRAHDRTAHCLLVDRAKEITGDIRSDR